MQTVHLVKYQHSLGEHYVYELPFSDPVDTERILSLLNRKWGFKELRFNISYDNTYHFVSEVKQQLFYSDEVVDHLIEVPVIVEVALKIGTRYYKLEEFDSLTTRNVIVE